MPGVIAIPPGVSLSRAINELVTLAVGLDEGEGAVNLPLVEDVLGVDVLVERVERRAVDEQEVPLAMCLGAVGEEGQPAVGTGRPSM